MQQQDYSSHFQIKPVLYVAPHHAEPSEFRLARRDATLIKPISHLLRLGLRQDAPVWVDPERLIKPTVAPRRAESYMTHA